MCRPAVEIARRHSTRLHRNLSRRTEMSILEIALASQIWARRREKRQLVLDDADALKVLLRIAFVFAAFTLLISGLNLVAGRPQMLADGSAPVVTGR
ncbi:hypothetical protein EHI47_02120 [Rhizobium leguminosarum]|uniref:Uncharacterized protein n=1 Tax=Rhizobium leguminosarum TaxID=384 RepID=A0A444IC77_RHILE|nr:hypothetical protein EHI47_02120 [Rhizobium leguminosarum]TBC93555.1 hypothetical protein ELH26_05765 [Rhizobium leguminosarum]